MKIYHTATREDYDALMIELESQGCKWFRGQKMQDFDAFQEHEEKTVIRVIDSGLVMFERLDKEEEDIIEYKAKGEIMDEKQFKKLAHELVMDITSTIGTFSLELDVTDEALAKTQKLIEECAVMLAEFIDSRKPKFEVGDYIVATPFPDKEQLCFARLERNIEQEKIHNIEGAWYIQDQNKVQEINFGINAKELIHATLEEVAEYKAALNFHDHGRKPFEVKKGDLISLDNNKRRKFTLEPDFYSKKEFVSGKYKLLKTAEELEKWLGADNE